MTRRPVSREVFILHYGGGLGRWLGDWSCSQEVLCPTFSPGAFLENSEQSNVCLRRFGCEGHRSLLANSGAVRRVKRTACMYSFFCGLRGAVIKFVILLVYDRSQVVSARYLPPAPPPHPPRMVRIPIGSSRYFFLSFFIS